MTSSSEVTASLALVKLRDFNQILEVLKRARLSHSA